MSKTPITDAKERESEGGCTSFDGAMRHAHYGWKLARKHEQTIAELEGQVRTAEIREFQEHERAEKAEAEKRADLQRISELESYLKKVEADNAALRKDAERAGLEWLRVNIAWGSADCTAYTIHRKVIDRLKAIDAAIAEPEQPSERRQQP